MTLQVVTLSQASFTASSHLVLRPPFTILGKQVVGCRNLDRDGGNSHFQGCDLLTRDRGVIGLRFQTRQ